MKILIVEDNAIISMELKSTLINSGYQVVGIAKSGSSAIQQAEEFLPEVILMDVGIKGELNGIQTARLINERIEYHLFYLSGNDLLSTNPEATATNPIGFISKPINTTYLISLLKDLDKRQAV